VRDFARLPIESAALVARMITRQGDLFRTSKLLYTESVAPGARCTLDRSGLARPTTLAHLPQPLQAAQKGRAVERARTPG